MILWKGRAQCVYRLYILLQLPFHMFCVFIINENQIYFYLHKGFKKFEIGFKFTNAEGYMAYYKMMNGSFEVGSYFTFEAKHYYLSKLDFGSQRAVLWETVTSKPLGKIIDLKTIKTMLDTADKNLH
jgi:hypothetical protein